MAGSLTVSTPDFVSPVMVLTSGSDLDGWASELVWHLCHVHSFPQRHEGPRYGPYKAAVPLEAATICGVVWYDFLFLDLLCELTLLDSSHELC